MADTRDSGNSRLAIIAGLTMIGIYAVQFVAARFSLREHLTATDLAILRFGGAGAVFLPIVWRSRFASMTALGWQRALALAALAGLPYPLIINWGLTYAPAAHAAALCPASIVFFSFLLSRIVFHDGASQQRTIGVLAIIAGLVLFIAPTGGGTGGVLFGDMLFIGSGLMFSTYAVLVRQWRADPVTATTAVVLLSCLPLPVLYFVAPSQIHAAAATEIVSQILIQGILSGAAAMFLYTYIVRQLGPQTASLFLPGIPIATVVVGMAVLGETPMTIQFAAIAIMAAGMGLSAIAERIASKRLGAPAPGGS
ncbi:DMT family transporter [Mesorhizobium sp. M2D.F.Ca.ET.185.01.1.1]|uniref:DMT family transporter n=1 Tax=unclassified Mesorhizobium TaxID=325217 RepID=UPI000FCA52AC|nr:MULTISPECIES: DMT family transporter [unclassified Mesorhizobium]TGP76385.1 DMT family transporter [bacterium M00.F.Ca.ET.227.01.1.1]TGP92437.1 DMT family transporter [bacterium M00.F.Ca.ET.222.01.1.1]TGP96992.1 DMT family transporter [bacterium M00.F.Ca.ET.221.01.1.1]TGT68484.1 DMT family transporter [bacterium M00.F.Ca.ET.159.01.1.1]TGT80319.1 DMT family transporter [bacterium M00.F.Ca.ET.157.01.1.1]TGU06547.1 DMT family transporter [bacterium M00.F.Ca.ET.163.01.1.1]TGU27826.1 DMT famil